MDGELIGVFCDRFSAVGKLKYDTYGVLYSVSNNGEREEINRYFKESSNGLREIPENEFLVRKNLYLETLKNERGFV